MVSLSGCSSDGISLDSSTGVITVTEGLALQLSSSMTGSYTYEAQDCDAIVYFREDDIIYAVIPNGTTYTLESNGVDYKIVGEPVGTTGTLALKLKYLKGTKTLIKDAIVSKGVDVSDTDTLRSYASKINDLSTGGETERVYLPAESSVDTTKNKKILLNPVSYYNDIQAEGAYTWNSTGYGSYTNNDYKAHLIRVYPDTLVRNDYDNGTYSSFRDDTGAYSSEIRDSAYDYPAAPYVIPNTHILNYKNTRIIFRQKGSNVFNLSDSINSHDWNYTLPICTTESDENIYICNSHIVYKINKKTFDITSYSMGVSIQPFYRLKDGYFYTVYGTTGKKLDLSTGSITSYTATDNGLPTSNSYYKGTIDGGLWFYMDTSGRNVFHVYKPVLTSSGDGYEFIKDEEKTQTVREILGFIDSTRCIIEPQIDGSIYIQNGSLLVGFNYDAATDTLTQITHPCSKIEIPDGYYIKRSTVNIQDGVCGVLIVENASPYTAITKYASLRELNLDDYTYVAYEPVKKNFTADSVTGISAGTTGTDENGNPYVDVTYVS